MAPILILLLPVGAAVGGVVVVNATVIVVYPVLEEVALDERKVS